MSHPEVVFRDLMHRTWKNLLFVEDLLREHEADLGKSHVNQNGPYEVTQLINSFLGAFGLPRENEIPNELADFTLAEAQEDWNFPVLEDMYPEHTMFSRDTKLLPKTQMNLNDVCKLVRNSILHGNFNFSGHIDAPRDTQIDSITFWNERQNNEKTRNWGCRLSISELRQVLSSFYCIACFIYKQFEEDQKKQRAG